MDSTRRGESVNLRQMARSRDPGDQLLRLTANAIAGDRDRCLAAGMDDYTTKPIDPDLMIEVIENNLPRQEIVPAALPEKSGSEIDLALASLKDRRLRVLLAEDNDFNQMVARKTLMDAGCTVDLASTGAAAVAAVARTTLMTWCSWIAKCLKWTASRQFAEFAKPNRNRRQAVDCPSSL